MLSTALARSRQTELIARTVQRLAPAKGHGSILDIGAGKGALVRTLLSNRTFASYTLLEPNLAHAIAHEELAAHGVRVVPLLLQDHKTDERYDVSVASHVLYDVPRSDWAKFIEDMLRRTKVGGHALIAMNAPASQLHRLRKQIWPTYETHSGTVVRVLETLGHPHILERQDDVFITDSQEEMLAVMHFAVLGGTIPAEQYLELSDVEKMGLDEQLREMARSTFDGERYKLAWQQDLITISH